MLLVTSPYWKLLFYLLLTQAFYLLLIPAFEVCIFIWSDFHPVYLDYLEILSRHDEENAIVYECFGPAVLLLLSVEYDSCR